MVYPLHSVLTSKICKSKLTTSAHFEHFCLLKLCPFPTPTSVGVLQDFKIKTTENKLEAGGVNPLTTEREREKSRLSQSLCLTSRSPVLSCRFGVSVLGWLPGRDLTTRVPRLVELRGVVGESNMA